jgi:hypothetical protein
MIGITILSVLLIAIPTVLTLLKANKTWASILSAVIAAIILSYTIIYGLAPFIPLAITAMLIWYMVYVNRGDRKSLIKAISITLCAALSFSIVLNTIAVNAFPVSMKVPKSYIMDLNESKSIDGTTIKLKKVLLDLNSISASYSVKGNEKVVAIELKKNPEDDAAINKCTGLWVGRKTLAEHSFVGMSYDGSSFMDHQYLVFYLSSGNSIPFEIVDKAGVRDKVDTVNIDRTIKYGSSYIKLVKFNKGLNYSAIGFESNFNPRNDIELTIITGNSEVKSGPSSWGSDGSIYQGSFSFEPVSGGNIRIKIDNKSLNKQDIIELSVK